ncbi:MAG: DUF1565 domain-containing protein [Deltaproteobacteria bacterium]|nr:DUF1565 domain-containing protein [Deltaproteobacteria bacterium]
MAGGAHLVACGEDNSGGIFYVDATAGNNSDSGRSPTSAFRTITHALNFARGGADIVVAPGLYSVAGGETFPLNLDSDRHKSIRGAGAGVTTLLDETGASPAVLQIWGSKQISGLSIDRMGTVPCQNCAAVRLDMRGGSHTVVFSDVSLSPAQPNAWALSAGGDRDASRTSLGTFEAQKLVVDGKGIGRGVNLGTLASVTITQSTFNAVVTPAINANDLVRLDAANLTVGVAKIGPDPGLGSDAPAVNVKQDNLSGQITTTFIRDTIITFAYAAEDAQKWAVGINKGGAGELIIERARIDLSATANSTGIRSDSPTQMTGATIVDGVFGAAFSRGLVMRASSFKAQRRAGLLIDPISGTAYDLGTESAPGGNVFSIGIDAKVDLALMSPGSTGNPTLSVVAVGNSWSNNRSPCAQGMQWQDVPDGMYQIAVEPTAGAVVQAAGQTCGTIQR